MITYQYKKLARGDRPHIFTGVKPWKPFIYCSIEETSFRDLTVKNLNDDIASIYSGPRYGSVQFMFSKGKLCKLSRTFKMYNRQFVQFARIPVEFVARL